MAVRGREYGFVLATIALTVYGQLVLKWRIGVFGALPDGIPAKLGFFARVFWDPWVLSSFAAAFLAALAWMAAVTKLDLSHAYPFMALNFVLVLLFSGWLFQEPVSVPKVIGVVLIAVGTLVSSLG